MIEPSERSEILQVFTQYKRLQKKQKKMLYINTMGVQGEDQTKIPSQDFYGVAL